MRPRAPTTIRHGGCAFLLMFLLAALTADPATAAGGYLWYQASAVFGSASASRYRTQIQNAASDYDSTDLTVGHTSNLVGGESYILFYEGNYGASHWVGRATAYNRYNQACSDANGNLTGNCNTTDRRAVRADIHIDLADQTWLNTGANAKYVIEHETGHIVGMSHMDCLDQSVMVQGFCDTRYSSLQPIDRSFINSTY